jgi:hypothetical protein
VDGRNPAPVYRWLIPLFIGFQPCKVVQDFFHPQYLVGVLTILNNISQWEGLSHILWKIKNV